MPNRPLRVTLITDAIGPPIRGNGTTVHRWLGWAPDVGVQIAPLHPGFALPPGARPDLVHGYHAVHGGMPAAVLAARHDLPLVVSLGGTDVYALRLGRPQTDRIRDVLQAATLVTGAFASFGEVLAQHLDTPPPYAVVPRGVHIPDAPAPTPGTALRILLPAGLRPVKDPQLGLALHDRLVAAGIPSTLTIAGPTLDPAYADVVRREAAARPGVACIEVPRSEMPSQFAAADVVWNTSHHEGGANALLEALAHGCAVYARDVPGNHDLLSAPDAPGRLFAGKGEDLIAFHAEVLEETPAARATRVAHARAWLAERHDSLHEARALRAAYEEACARGGCGGP